MYGGIKRGMDFLLSCIGFVLLIPLFIVLIIAIKLDSPGPALFRQKRVGIHKSYFYIWKFRTMPADAPKDIPTHLQKDTEYVATSLGRFLRRTSLDELPQLVNIIRGDMSIVGPRPALWNQDDLIEERDKYGANDVRPGLTGWAQINGRDELDIFQKAKLDGEYVKNMGVGMDMKCFFGTFLPVLRADGVWDRESDKKG
jgi:O-antigen biosynthesis protein WbqP